MTEEKRSPRPAPDIVEDGIPAVEEVGQNVLETGDSSDEGEIAPLDFPQGTNQWGTTASEQRRDEPLDQRYLHEQSENRSPSHDQVLPFSSPDSQDGGLFDSESEEIAEQDFELEDALSPEESAMHFEDET